MKKIKVNDKLSLNKKHVSQLNEEQMNMVNGGGFLSIGRVCTKDPHNCNRFTQGLFCGR